MRNGLLLVLALACGCGGGGNLDPALGGTWIGNGHFTVTTIGTGDQFPVKLTVAVSGQDATISFVCFNDTGALTLHGSGPSANWEGTFTCPPVDFFAGCPAVVLTFQSVNVSLSGSALLAHSVGIATGCGAAIVFSLDMTGTK